MAVVLPEIIIIRDEGLNHNIKNITFNNLFDSIGEYLYESIETVFE
jgi:hypothetical protein